MWRSGENPWQTLRGRPVVRLWWSLLPPGVDAVWDGDEIHIDFRLSRTERRCALMHELVHHERQVGWPDASAATMEREEQIVRSETARRLVPPEHLARWVEARAEVEPITAELVAQEWDVTAEVARVALRQV